MNYRVDTSALAIQGFRGASVGDCTTMRQKLAARRERTRALRAKLDRQRRKTERIRARLGG